jgi:N-acetylmuramoyl-L-alanine amidase
MPIRKLLFLLIAFLLIPFLRPAFAAPGAPTESAYESLKARYMKLRNTDKEIARQAQWREIITDLEAFANSHKNSKNAPVALSQSAAMSLEMYKVLKEKEYLDKAKGSLELILEEFRLSDEADDALIKLSEIYSEDLNDKDSAVAALKRLIKNYPSGDMVEAAQIRLKSLENGPVKEEEEEHGTAADAGQKVNVIIDPGHGGEDFGAVGVGGLYEKDVVLDVSHKIKKILEDKYKLKTILSRHSDVFVPLYERTSTANENNADVFISIHANASEKKNLSGLEIYYLDNTSDKASKKLADRENASMQYEGPEADLRYMLSDLIQDSKLKDSLRLANLLGPTIIGSLKEKGYTLKNHGTKKAPFYVLVGAYMPCILVEIGFIDNADDGQKLADKAFRDQMAEAIADGVSVFLTKK